MSYYAYAQGEIFPKDELSTKEIKKIIKKSSYHIENDNHSFITICHDGNYNENEDNAFLNNIAKFITDGSIEYKPEDSDGWKSVFNENTKEWETYPCRKIYDLGDISNDELLKELEKRGYNIPAKKEIA